jgi:spore coat-associated protein N
MQRGFMALARPTIKWFVVLLALCATTVTVADLPSSTASHEDPTKAHATISLGATTHSGRIENLAPGDTVATPFEVMLSERGGKRIALNITTLAGKSSRLDTHARSGLRFSIEQCAQPEGWRKGKAKLQFSCAGPRTVILEAQPLAQAKNRMISLPTLKPGVAAQLLLKFSLPLSAGNSFEGRISSLRLTFLTRP